MSRHSTHISLLDRISRGNDPLAWREFADRYGDLIRGFGRRRGLSAPDCEDLVQDVLTNFLSSLPQFRYDPAKGRFRGYLKTIATNAILRRSHQRGPRTALPEVDAVALDESGAAESEAAWEAEWRHYHLRLAMRTIDAEFSSSDRAAFQRYGVDGGSATETAEALGMSVDSVYQAKSRIVRRLGELIRAQIDEEG